MEDNKNNNTYMHFILGIVLVGAGLFLLLQQTDVTMSFANFRIGSFGVPSGLVVVPLLIGVIMLVYNSKSILARIITILGAVIIFAAIIMSTRIVFRTTNMYNYVLMIVLIGVGVGLILRYVFRKKEK